MGEILNDITEFDSKLVSVSIDSEEYEFLIIYCLNCGENFGRLFEKTKYCGVVINKMFELAKNYMENLKKQPKGLTKDRLCQMNNYILRVAG